MRAVVTVPETESLVAALRAQSQRYHDRHPFHRKMNEGGLSRRQVQGWVANRFYYQENLPLKDAAILANCPHREVRRRWIRRILDHDGTVDGEGGIEAWLRLGEAVGLTRDEVQDERHVVPGVRFAVDAYVNFSRTRPWVEAVASSLTELFAPDLMAERLADSGAFVTRLGRDTVVVVLDSGVNYDRDDLANRNDHHDRRGARHRSEDHLCTRRRLTRPRPALGRKVQPMHHRPRVIHG